MSHSLSIFWFRRDLRINDNAGLYHALKNSERVLPIFIFDTNILHALEDPFDRRVDFIQQALQSLHLEFNKHGGSLRVLQGTPLESFKQLLHEFSVTAVYTNHDYEPYAKQRDNEIADLLRENGVAFHTFKDQCIFEKNEVLKDDGSPYTVFTPYANKWKKTLKPFYFKAYPTKNYLHRVYPYNSDGVPSVEELGFRKTDLLLPKRIQVDDDVLRLYKQQRDFPAVHGTSRLSMHLRFGTVSIRALVAKAIPLSEAWLNELIWRDFYMMILWHFPHVVGNAFKKEYDRIEWRNNEFDFERWCSGQTGFPIVDAGMRELNQTGFMHNRVRMIVSSFLIKDLLIDWRWGEAYFAKKLNDFDLSANNGGWQWAASSGCDAAPYFRVFNPYEQQKKFDPDLRYVKKWVPEYGSEHYPKPMVDHAQARLRVLAVYKEALSGHKQMNLQF